MNKKLKLFTFIVLLGCTLLTSAPAHAATVTSLGENIDKQKYLSIPEVKKSLGENNEKKCDVYMSVIYDELEGLPIEESEDVLKQQYYCHVNYGALKTPWNIEPSKSSINSITCN
ncbi:hypothetical protein [Clostridium sp. M14]|uniref:hypothetical protein n=1 Tax=Clostridium sp. M14 TaxID=2716311 RepID=UPI001CCF95C7|nr:hypothetical protein [Clostridium sp. M14]MBZ9693437.1 hypothetical protein [Clostridium sp. M14]